VKGESSLAYWERNVSCTSGKKISAYKLIKNVLTNDYDLSLHLYEKWHLRKLVNNVVKAAPQTGVLYQIFLKPWIVNEVLLISQSSGVPLSYWADETEENQKSCAWQMLDFLCSDPLAFKSFMIVKQEQFMETDRGWIDQDIQEHIRGTPVAMKPWHIQARLLVNPAITPDPSKMRIKKYY